MRFAMKNGQICFSLRELRFRQRFKKIGDKIQGPSWGQQERRKKTLFWHLLGPRFEWLEVALAQRWLKGGLKWPKIGLKWLIPSPKEPWILTPNKNRLRLRLRCRGALN